jgi:hypothetical protein
VLNACRDQNRVDRGRDRFILSQYPNARIGLLYQNDESGKDYLAGFEEALGASANQRLVGEASYDATDPTSTRKSCGSRLPA